MRHLQIVLRGAIALYLIVGIVGLLQFAMSIFDRSGMRHDPADGVLAIIVGLPWSLLMGVLLYPDSTTGLVILIVSIGINLAILTWLARRASLGLSADLIGLERLARSARFAGSAATSIWAVLAVLTMASTLITPDPSTLGLTLSVAAVFFAVAAILFWRTSAVFAVCKESPASAVIASLALSEIVTAAAVFMIGALLTTAVVSRVFGEGLPLFG